MTQVARCARALTSRRAIMDHLSHTYRNVLLQDILYHYLKAPIGKESFRC